MNRLFYFILLFLLCFEIQAQNIEVGITTGVNISNSSLVAADQNDWLSYKKALPIISLPIILNVQYKLLNKNNFSIYCGGNIFFVNNKYYQRLISDRYNYNIKSIKFNESFFRLGLHVDIDYNLTDYFSIGARFSTGYNLILNGEKKWEGNGKAINETLNYKYIINLKSQNRLIYSLNFFMKTKLNDKFKIYSSIGYDFGNKLSYAFFYTQSQQEIDQNTGEMVIHNSNFFDENINLDFNYINFKIGVIRSF